MPADEPQASTAAAAAAAVKKGSGHQGKSSTSTSSAWARRSRKKAPDSSRIVANLDKIIFPDDRWIKRWDLLVLALLLSFAFILPYQIGVSGGYYLMTSTWWLVVNVLMNAVFFVDTFLQFRRPYRGADGKLVIDLRRIRRRYLREAFVPNFISVLPYTLVFYFTSQKYVLDATTPPTRGTTTIILLLNLLKLIRLARIRRILSESQAVIDVRMRSDSQVLQLFMYVWLITVLSHWFACVWCWTAYLENGNFQFMETSNWISGFVNNTEAGLGEPNPIGAENDQDRYVISLFWAIQTITSIGYGNISPVTVTEYWVGSVLQLLAGMSWAYVIGGLVAVAAGFNAKAENHRSRIDAANDMIRDFDAVDEEDDPRLGSCSADDVARQIRTYINDQYIFSKNTVCASSLNDNYPIFSSLTPKLQNMSSILVLKRYLDVVPYLSSRYLNMDDQAEVARQCVAFEFPPGELIHTGSGVLGYGRGIFILKSGCATALKFSEAISLKKRRLIAAGTALGTGRVLLEDGHPKVEDSAVHFLTFSKVLFIPRDVVLAALEKKNRAAWRKCGRWMYLRCLMCTKSEV